MQQSQGQRIGLRANDIFNYLRPENWIVRSTQEIDFGVDYEIEILDDTGKTTGSFAKVQLKGSENLSYINNGEAISFSFEIDNAKYLIEEISMPTYLFVCDNNTEKCYWVSFKTDKTLNDAYRLALNNNQQTFSVHIDIVNDFSETHKEIIRDMAMSNKINASKLIQEINFYDYAGLSKNIDIGNFKETLLNQIENVDLYEMQQLSEKEDFSALLELIEKNLKSDKSISFKFNTLAYKKLALRRAASRTGMHISEIMEYRSNADLNIGLEYVELTNNLKDNDILKIASKLWLNLAILYKLSSKFQWLNISVQQHEKEPEDFTGFWLLTISSQINELSKEIAKIIDESLGQINSIVTSNYYSLLIDIVPEFVMSMIGFLFFLIRNNEEAFKLIENHLDLLVNLSLDLSKVIYNNKPNWNRFELLIQVKLQYKSLFLNSNMKILGKKLKDDIYPYISQIPDKNLRRELFLQVKNYIKNLIDARDTTEGNISIDEEIALLKDQMRGLGVDISNPQTDEDMAIVEAIDALNPERALRNCVHLYVYQSITSPLGQMLKLSTLGVKGLCCTKKYYQVENVFLDNVSHFMEQRYCSKCKAKKAHTKSWKWTREWQEEQHKKFHKKLFPKNNN